MPSVEPGAGRRGPLDRRTILLAAITMIDENDLRYLTMRRLGAHLGVEGMALYHYVHGREDLLDGIVELVIDDLYGDPEVHLSSTEWQDYLQRLAHGVRRIALAHPQVFPLIATRPPAAPWVRPPLRSLRWMESFLETLYQCGFTDSGCVAAYRRSPASCWATCCSRSPRWARTSDRSNKPILMTNRKTDLTEYPRLKSLEPEFSQDHSVEEFEESLETLIERIDLLDRRPRSRARRSR